MIHLKPSCLRKPKMNFSKLYIMFSKKFSILVSIKIQHLLKSTLLTLMIYKPNSRYLNNSKLDVNNSKLRFFSTNSTFYWCLKIYLTENSI